jgi:hypothetical protein
MSVAGVQGGYCSSSPISQKSSRLGIFCVFNVKKSQVMVVLQAIVRSTFDRTKCKTASLTLAAPPTTDSKLFRRAGAERSIAELSSCMCSTDPFLKSRAGRKEGTGMRHPRLECISRQDDDLRQMLRQL